MFYEMNSDCYEEDSKTNLIHNEFSNIASFNNLLLLVMIMI